MQNPKWFIGALAIFICTCICFQAAGLNKNAIVELKQKVRYDCSNSVDCLAVHTDDEVQPDKSVPSDFLKNVVEEVAEKNYVPPESKKLISLAQKYIDVGQRELQRAKQLDSQAKLREEKALRLQKLLIDVTASYNSKKKLADWYFQQADQAKIRADQETREIYSLQRQNNKLGKQIGDSSKVLDYLNSLPEKSAPAATPSTDSENLPSPQDLQRAFEFGGRFHK